jgi:hypothetical protein
MMDEEEVGLIYPRMAMPGSLATAAKKKNLDRLNQLNTLGPSLYRVEAIVGPHIPLSGSLQDLIAHSPTTGVSVNEPPLSMYLHHGGVNAVFLELRAQSDGTLSCISIEVDAVSPLGAFVGARTEVNQLLDVLMRRLWIPLVIVRLDLFADQEERPIAHELLAPFSGQLRIGPLGGIHQNSLFYELESHAREAICSTSPYYRFLCAFRVYEGVGVLRGKLRQMCIEAGIDEPLPKDQKIDLELLNAMGLTGLSGGSVRTLNDLHGKLTEMRNQVAHFLLSKGGVTSALHTSDGLSYRVYSSASAVLLHYGVEAVRELYSFFQQYLSALAMRGNVLPQKDQRDRYRVVVR